MNLKRNIKTLFLVTLLISVFSSVYLYTQIGVDPGFSDEFTSAYTSSSLFDKTIFPEVEVVKVVLEKIIDIVTISKL